MYALTDYADSHAVQTFFKWVPTDEYEGHEMIGDIESGYGLFGYVTVDADLLTYYGSECPTEYAELKAAMDNANFDILPFSDYLVTLDFNGLVWAERGVAPSVTWSEFCARRDNYDTECAQADREAECEAIDDEAGNRIWSLPNESRTHGF